MATPRQVARDGAGGSLPASPAGPGFAFAGVPVHPRGFAESPAAGALTAPSAGLLLSEPADASEHEARSVAERLFPLAPRPAAEDVLTPPPARQNHVGTGGSCATCGSAGKALGARADGGMPLPADTRAEMEAAFGADFASVRVHTGAEAASLSRSLKARAFTYGSEIFFEHGQYEPNSERGKRLLAHELTHTMQQRDAAASLARDGEAPTTLKCLNDNLSAAGVASWLIVIIGGTCGLVGAFAGSPTGPGAAGTAALAAAGCIAFLTGFAVGAVLAIIRGCAGDPNFKSRGAYLSSNTQGGGAATPGAAPPDGAAAAPNAGAEMPA